MQSPKQWMRVWVSTLSLIAVSAQAQPEDEAADPNAHQPTAIERQNGAATESSPINSEAASTQAAGAVSAAIPNGTGEVARAIDSVAAGPQPPKPKGRVRLPPSSDVSGLSICEKAQVARARSSPAAPGLEAQCAAQPIDLVALAARGEIVVAQDPLAVELFEQQSDELARFGFRVGMAAWEGNTAPGPGKDRIRASLAADKQGGFDNAAEFSLARNSNTELLGIGAAIAETDSRVARLRGYEPSVFYRIGFDIASGIFGDPAKGAKGNTATGPGSMKIRDSLNETGQRAFDRSVKLHLSRNYLAPRPSEAELAEAVANANAAVLAEVEFRISDYRREHGLGPVTLDAALMQIATSHATGMADEDQLTHVLPGEGSLKQRLMAGNFQGPNAYEALFGATGTKAWTLIEVLDQWIASPEHNRNLLAPAVSRIGIFVAFGEPASKFQTYWSLMLGESSAPLPPDDGAVAHVDLR